MKKEDSGALGAALIILAIVAYGLKTEQSWKYYLFTILFLPGVGYTIGDALGKEDNHETKN